MGRKNSRRTLSQQAKSGSGQRVRPRRQEWAPRGDGLRWDDPQVRNVSMVPYDTWLTHLSDRSEPSGFRELPRWDHEHRGHFRIEVAMSMLEGRLSSEDAQMAVRRMSTIRRGVKVRRFIAGDLIRASYIPHRTPTRAIPNHVSVYGDLSGISEDSQWGERPEMYNDVDAHMRWWNNPGREPLASLVREEAISD